MDRKTGIVSIAYRIPRYVDPQTTYTTARAAQTLRPVLIRELWRLLFISATRVIVLFDHAD